MTKSTIPIVFIEDSKPYSSALEKFFKLPSSTVDCKAIFSNAEEALIQIPRNPPSIALVDINLPGKNGIECIAQLKELCPSLVCLVLTMYEEDEMIFEALRAGASGYLLKSTPPAEIVEALHIANAGGSPMTPHIARQVVGFFHRTPAPKPDVAFTPREQEVLNLLIEGESYKAIAAELGVSIDTVRSHVRKVYSKLHIHSRTEIMLKFGNR